jgi:hypothetical protein
MNYHGMTSMIRTIEPYQIFNSRYPEEQWREHNITTRYLCTTGNIITRNDVFLYGSRIINLPKFKYVAGKFCICNLKIESLYGCPLYVGGDVDCSLNYELTSAKYSPLYIGKNAIYSSTNITNLEDINTEVRGDFIYTNRTGIPIQPPTLIVHGKFRRLTD